MLEANRFVLRVIGRGNFEATTRSSGVTTVKNGQRRYPQNVLKDLLIRPGDRVQVLERAMDSAADAFAHASRKEGRIGQESDPKG
ncbi:hypothetical protein OKW34_007685 [Paraburkholderia youngii]|uniref:hypothetical protein n=1 Tax=Paraburkholderia youngii TaxID=2782701 RepID=UPI003D1B68A9